MTPTARSEPPSKIIQAIGVALAAILGAVSILFVQGAKSTEGVPYATKSDLIEVITPLRVQIGRVEDSVSALQQEAAITRFERDQRTGKSSEVKSWQ